MHSSLRSIASCSFPHFWEKMFGSELATLTPSSHSKQTAYNFSLTGKVLLC